MTVTVLHIAQHCTSVFTRSIRAAEITVVGFGVNPVSPHRRASSIIFASMSLERAWAAVNTEGGPECLRKPPARKQHPQRRRRFVARRRGRSRKRQREALSPSGRRRRRRPLPVRLRRPRRRSVMAEPARPPRAPLARHFPNVRKRNGSEVEKQWSSSGTT